MSLPKLPPSTTKLSNEISDKNDKNKIEETAETIPSYNKLISSLIGIINPNNTLLNIIKLTLSDAVIVLQNYQLAPGTYNVYDINKTLIAYAWFQQENNDVTIEPLYHSYVLNKRVN